MMMNTEFHDWNAAHTYTEIEKINWLLNAIKTLEEKDKYAQHVRNNLYEIIKQQQAKANEAKLPEREAKAYEQHIKTLNTEISNLRIAFQDQQARLSKVYTAVTGR